MCVLVYFHHHQLPPRDVDILIKAIHNTKSPEVVYFIFSTNSKVKEQAHLTSQLVSLVSEALWSRGKRIRESPPQKSP